MEYEAAPETTTHRIHVWYIHLHLVDYGKLVGKYSSPMDPSWVMLCLGKSSPPTSYNFRFDGESCWQVSSWTMDNSTERVPYVFFLQVKFIGFFETLEDTRVLVLIQLGVFPDFFERFAKSCQKASPLWKWMPDVFFFNQTSFHATHCSSWKCMFAKATNHYSSVFWVFFLPCTWWLLAS